MEKCLTLVLDRLLNSEQKEKPISISALRN